MSDLRYPNGTTTKPHVSSPFGPRRAPIPGASTYHRGADFSNTFSLIRAVAPGCVVAVNVWPALGYSVWIQHDGYFSKSGHMKAHPPVKVGDWVEAGQTIGVMGKTGTATDTHLHFEITPGTFHTANTGQVDPVTFISSRLAATAGGSTTPAAPIQSEEDDEMTATFINIQGKGGSHRGGCYAIMRDNSGKLFARFVSANFHPAAPTVPPEEFTAWANTMPIK